MQKCSLDCFNCPFSDCILSDDEIQLTELEIRESENRDADAKRFNCEADYVDDGEKSAADARRREAKHKSYMAHRAEELRKRKLYRETHKEAKNAADKAYYEANREAINARRRERRRLEKAFRKSLKGENATKKQKE